jgi:hypothetical protein
MNTIKFISMAEGDPIQAYPNYNGTTEEEIYSTHFLKQDWLKTGKRLLSKLAKELHLPKGSYEVRVNAGGVAVSGDVILHGEWIYINLSQSCVGPAFGFYWRLCRGRKDYTGLTNRWAKWDNLLDLSKLACIMAFEYEQATGKQLHTQNEKVEAPSCGCCRFSDYDCAVHENQINGTPMAHVDPCLCPCHYDGCGDCDPCLGGRPDQCAIEGTPNAKVRVSE